MMKLGKFLTHGLAAAAGLAVAFAFTDRTGPAGTPLKAADSTSLTSARHTVRPEVIRPRELLRSLVNVPMEKSERTALKSKIYEDWVKQDPLGCLTYFEHRRWPDGFYGDGPFEILAKTQPEELLAYARRNGSREAVSTLVKVGEPGRVLEVLGRDGLARLPGHTGYPGDLLEDFVRRGEETDPQFHEKLARVADGTAQERALREVAETMKGAGRLEELLSFTSRYPEAFDDHEIGSRIAPLLSQDPREMERLDWMSESLRAETAREILSSLSSNRVGDENERAIFSGLASRGLLAGSGKELFESIADRGEDAEPEERNAWKSWAMSLPQDETTRPLRLASMVRWADGSPEQLETLPPGELRDAATVGAVGRSMEKEDPGHAKALAGRIGDSGLRERMLHFLDQMEKGEEPDDFDPFGLGK